MKVGLITPYDYDTYDSLNYVYRVSSRLLSKHHELLYFPPRYAHFTPNEHARAVEEWLCESDVVIGRVDRIALQARERAGVQTPYICLLLGCLSRGGADFIDTHRLFKTSDYLIGNCSADLSLVHKIFSNATARMLPFGIDETTYWRLGRDKQVSVRESMGLSMDALVLLYSGRLSLEKNLHTLLKVFAVVQERVSSAHLVIAGNESTAPFNEFGVYPLGLSRTLKRLSSDLEINPDKIRFLGPCTEETLRNLYNAADLLVNFTLNHDENFGLAPVEAMFCGTPVVATNWGGLQDTVVDGISGNKINTLVTPSGVKIDWLQAVDTVTTLLLDREARMQLSNSCRWWAQKTYSLAAYADGLETIVNECKGTNGYSDERLEPTEFARRYWTTGYRKNNDSPPYRFGTIPFALYRELIEAFAGKPTIENKSTGDLAYDEVLCMPAPLSIGSNDCIVVNDPLYPLDIPLPATLKAPICYLIGAFAASPVLSVRKLLSAGDDKIQTAEALTWLCNQGLLIRSIVSEGSLKSYKISSALAKPFFSIHKAPRHSDVIAIS